MDAKEALKILYPNTTYEPYHTKVERREACRVIEKELEDFKWLKSKVSIDWFDKLSSDDKIRVLQILGLEIEY